MYYLYPNHLKMQDSAGARNAFRHRLYVPNIT